MADYVQSYSSCLKIVKLFTFIFYHPVFVTHFDSRYVYLLYHVELKNVIQNLEIA